MTHQALRLPGAAGITLAADAYGDPDGAPVVLLHGGGQTRHSYRPHRPRPRTTDGLRKNLRCGDDGRWHWNPAFLSGPLVDDLESGRLEQAALSVACPIALVRGGISDVVTEVEAAAFGALLPRAQQVEIPRAGHMVAGDDNDAFSSAVLDHLRAAA